MGQIVPVLVIVSLLLHLAQKVKDTQNGQPGNYCQ